MRVFVAGASGVIGRPLIERLLRAGHEVTALARTEEKATALRAQGVEPAIADALDVAALREAVIAARPEVVVNQLTALPANINPRKYERDLAPTNRLRGEVGPALTAAAADAGARRVISQSVCFMLDPSGPWVQDEDAPLYRDPPAVLRDTVAAMRTLEDATLNTPGVEGLVLRYGFFYGEGQLSREGATAQEVRRRRMPVVGSGEGHFSFIHVDDAADATLLALDHGAPGIYNITDDEPALQRDWVRELARAIGAPKPLRVPLWLGRLAAGEMAKGAVTLRGSSNAKARRELGWEPAHPSWRAGFAEVFGGA